MAEALDAERLHTGIVSNAKRAVALHIVARHIAKLGIKLDSPMSQEYVQARYLLFALIKYPLNSDCIICLLTVSRLFAVDSPAVLENNDRVFLQVATVADFVNKTTLQDFGLVVWGTDGLPSLSSNPQVLVKSQGVDVSED